MGCQIPAPTQGWAPSWTLNGDKGGGLGFQVGGLRCLPPLPGHGLCWFLLGQVPALDKGQEGLSRSRKGRQVRRRLAWAQGRFPGGGAGYLLETCPTELGLQVALHPTAWDPDASACTRSPAFFPAPSSRSPPTPLAPLLSVVLCPHSGGGEPLGHLVWLEKGSPKWPRCRWR